MPSCTSASDERAVLKNGFCGLWRYLAESEILRRVGPVRRVFDDQLTQAVRELPANQVFDASSHVPRYRRTHAYYEELKTLGFLVECSEMLANVRVRCHVPQRPARHFQHLQHCTFSTAPAAPSAPHPQHLQHRTPSTHPHLQHLQHDSLQLTPRALSAAA